MKKLFVLVALVGMLTVGWPVAPASAGFGEISDTDDQAIAAGDILGGSLTHLSTVTVRLTVQTPENPNTDANWVDGDSFIVWSLDTDGDANIEWEVDFSAVATNQLVVGVFPPGSNDAACEGTASYDNGVYQASFPRSCIGNPADIQFFAELEYDPTPGSGTDNQVDRAPNEGISAAVAGPADEPSLDREVRAGVVGQGDNQLWVARHNSGIYDPFGGQLTGAPAIGRIPGESESDVATPLFVATGTDNALWVRTPDKPWTPLSDARTYCIGNPGALVYADSGGSGLRITVACRGSDNGLWKASGPLSADTLPKLNSWVPAGGILTAGPAVGISQQDGDKVTILVTGVGGKVYQHIGTGFSPTPWTCKDHVAFGSLNDTSWFGCRGTDDGLWAAENSPSGWGTAFPLGGKLAGGPGVAVTAESAAFFVQGIDNSLWETVVDHGSHARSPFLFIGGRLKFGVGATAL